MKRAIRDIVDCRVISQDEVVPGKLADYLSRHPEIDSKLSRGASRKYAVTDLPPSYEDLVRRLAGTNLALEKVEI
jgi:glutamate racemase